MSFPNNESTNNVKIKTESNKKKKNNNNTNVDFLPFPSPVKSFDRLADDNATSSNNIASNQHQQEAQQQQQQVNIKISESCDEGNSESEDDDEEHHYTPPDPDYTQANKLPFRSLCQIFESVWSLRRTQNNTNSSIMMSRNKRGATKYEKLAILLPKKLDTMLKGGSLFPVLRLMVPDLDTHRPHMGMKEASIGKIWAEAIGLGQSSPAYKKLIKFTDPVLAGPTACGDISMAVYEVILKRFPEFVVDYNKNNNTEKETRKKQKKNKGITIGKMNQLLDELANIKHSGNQLQAQQSLTSLSSKGSGSNFTKQRRKIKWVENLFNLKLTPLEHKWIVRIILSHLNLGVGSDSIINYYHPWADNLYAANKNIKTLCATLCDDEYIRRRAEAEKKDLKMLGNHNRSAHLPKTSEPAAFNHTISPMLSERTSFESFLHDIQKRHLAYNKTLEQGDQMQNLLALKYPTFSAEIKMDGERILSHIRKGVVKIQTRNSSWYSELYSPVLGPPLRRALGKYNVDVILDGEVIAWDNARKKTIDFGMNRGIAIARKKYMHRHGLLDERDTNLHDNEDGVKILTQALTSGYDKNKFHDNEGVESGKETWLKYILFDILYIGGPDASKVMDDAFDPFDMDNLKPSATGSIINLDMWMRRRILHTLIAPQPHTVEIVETTIIRTDGQAVDGQTYFSSTKKDQYSYSPMIIDSINCILDMKVPNFKEIDKKRLQFKSAKEMDKARKRSLDKVYGDIVRSRQLEGLIFKDLCAPYGLGPRFRSMGYWFKLKDDYNKTGHANDIDLVVVGAQFATGQRHKGILNTFLCACVDSDRSSGTKFMTCAYVSGGSVSNSSLYTLLENTGFFGNKELGHNRTFGKWFKLNHGELPDFLSQRTFQQSLEGANTGWDFKKHQYPDMWIDPKDSFVFTINAGEITSSQDFSAGVALRFPRISKIRATGFDNGPKPAEDAEVVTNLHNLYQQRKFQQNDAERESQSQSKYSMDFDEDVAESKFMSCETYINKDKIRKERPKQALNVRLPRMESNQGKESNHFKGYTFNVLDGTYNLFSNTLDEKQAKAEGYYKSASAVRNQQDVINFIQQHGGVIVGNDSTFIVGGKSDDARVANYRKAIEGTTESNLTGKRKTDKVLLRMIQNGVVKWTFFFSSISKQRESLQQPINLVPRKYDYLAISKTIEQNLEQIEDSYGIHLLKNSNIFELKRALRKVKKRNLVESEICARETGKKMKRRKNLWQHHVDASFTKEEKEIIIGKRHNFCNYGGLFGLSSQYNNGTMILYPDIFRGTKKSRNLIQYNNSEISSVLPLATCMGAKVCQELNDEVTHILCCNIKDDYVIWLPQITMEVFCDVHHGYTLHEQIMNMRKKNSISIILISSAWVRKVWKNS